MKREKSFGETMLERLEDFSKKLNSGELMQSMNVTEVTLDLCPSRHDAKSVKTARAMLGVSQPIFARILAVSLSTVRSWEQGQQVPSGPACRLLDEIVADPERWKKWIATKTIRRRRGKQKI